MNGKRYNRRSFLRTSSFLTAIPAAVMSAKGNQKKQVGLEDGRSDKSYFDKDPVRIGSTRQLFVDDFLIDYMGLNIELLLHHPVPREVVMTYDRKWEGSYCNNHSIFKDGDLYRMYYAGVNYIVEPGKVIDDQHPFCLCYAESKDGVHWERPDLGFHEFQGSKANNILMVNGKMGDISIDASSAAFFKDENPDATPDAKYKGIVRVLTPVGSGPLGVYAFKSADAIHWVPMTDKAVITNGAFDSQNLAFWDPFRREYRAYWRSKTLAHVREIRTAVSKDFIHWTDETDLRYVDSPEEELYTNVVKSYYRAEDLIIGFPVRYIERPWGPSMDALPELKNRKMRASAVERFGTALTGTLFMASRDGVLFKRWNEAFLRPGIERPGSWNYGQQFLAWQIVETPSSLEGAPNEMSFYATESCWTDDSDALRRYTMRADGFVSVWAPLDGGELVTRPLIFKGSTLSLNFSTSGAGGIQVELTDKSGSAIPGFSYADCLPVFGDTLDRVVSWNNGSDVSGLSGKEIRLRFKLKDADLFSFRFQ